MGTITTRTLKDGSKTYRAAIVIKQQGLIRHRESRTFDRITKANAWIKLREEELKEPNALARAKKKHGTLADAITIYLKEDGHTIGTTKAQCLRSILETDLAQMLCEDIQSHHIVEFAMTLREGREPSTVGNYLSHLSAVINVARPSWGFQIDPEVMVAARSAMKRRGITGKSNERDRRPTMEELDALMQHFFDRSARGNCSPMEIIIPFAIFSTRRQSEIAGLLWQDYAPERMEKLVRDMKHPGQRRGNNVVCAIGAEGKRLIDLMPQRGPRIFPYAAGGVSKAFTDACKLLEIKDLHFHDLRHEAISRLFEMGMNIPVVAKYSGHKTWANLQRYTNIIEQGDRFKDWHWWPKIEIAAKRLAER